jgi:hypothetical protein
MMITRPSLGLLVLVLSNLCSFAVAAQDLDWTMYRDPHGCRLDYPRTLFSPDPQQANKPQRFSSSEQDIYFRVMGAENTAGWTPADIRRKYLTAEMPGDITYQRTKGTFLVLSGYREGNIFYTKVAVSDDRSIACILDITYPQSLKRQFDRIVTRMSRSFTVSR